MDNINVSVVFRTPLNRETNTWIISLGVRMATMVVYRFWLSVVARVLMGQARPGFNHITTITAGMFSTTRRILKSVQHLKI